MPWFKLAWPPLERLEEPDIGEQRYGDWEGIAYAELAERQLEAANGGPLAQVLAGARRSPGRPAAGRASST